MLGNAIFWNILILLLFLLGNNLALWKQSSIVLSFNLLLDRSVFAVEIPTKVREDYHQKDQLSNSRDEFLKNGS